MSESRALVGGSAPAGAQSRARMPSAHAERRVRASSVTDPEPPPCLPFARRSMPPVAGSRFGCLPSRHWPDRRLTAPRTDSARPRPVNARAQKASCRYTVTESSRNYPTNAFGPTASDRSSSEGNHYPPRAPRCVNDISNGVASAQSERPRCMPSPATSARRPLVVEQLFA
jgi:hypothetical protein